jgi:hypothetical protein
MDMESRNRRRTVGVGQREISGPSRGCDGCGKPKELELT